MTATVTADFREEFEADGARRLRKRFLWYCGIALALGALSLFRVVARLSAAPAEVKLDAWIIAIGSAGATAPYIWAFVYAIKHRAIKRQLLIRIVFWLIVMTGLVNLGLGPFSQRVSEAITHDFQAKQTERGPAEQADEQGLLTETDDIAAGPSDPNIATAEHDPNHAPTPQFTVSRSHMGIGSMWMINLFISHMFASLFIPWTPREAIAPLIPLLIVNTLGVIGFKLFNDSESWLTVILVIVFSPMVGVPGTLICWWRHSRHRQRFHYKMLRGRYGEIKHEFNEARKIHEALFPKPITEGPLRMDFIYEPMRQIGGDFLFCRSTAREDGSTVLHAVLIDVTGHGLTAALTVNRIVGEIEREFGVNPDASPASILTGLNDYIHHTLALHSVYATALAVRIDSRENKVLWASAGHPPAFLRAVDGAIERLDSTALVLGACLGDDFVVEELSHRFGPGDALLVYTDGATEARNADGTMLGVRGIEAVMANGRPEENGGWALTVMKYVEQHRTGPTEDDTLLVEIYRPLKV